jgi:periplasmic divalent cation tolerance protein|uniref:Divalent-cation tolerance protein CutA n=1 Tax=Leptospirillum ferriphilum TaxID=178606 RepID=A0A7C3QSQ4_9BACT
MNVSLLLFSHPDPQGAEQLVRDLVEEGYVACGHLFPTGTSIYFWEGKIVRDSEVNILLKLSREVCPVVIDKIRSVHPYSVPEILCWAVEEGNPDYMDWVLSNSRQRKNHEG